jgi:hypothetical protein
MENARLQWASHPLSILADQETLPEFKMAEFKMDF